jgi:hypothetical protein
MKSSERGLRLVCDTAAFRGGVSAKLQISLAFSREFRYLKNESLEDAGRALRGQVQDLRGRQQSENEPE